VEKLEEEAEELYRPRAAIYQQYSQRFEARQSEQQNLLLSSMSLANDCHHVSVLTGHLRQKIALDAYWLGARSSRLEARS